LNINSKTAHVSDCKVCYGEHSDDIHDATLRVRSWLRYEVTRKLSDPFDPATQEEGPALVA
jgi:hypothetical protein